MGVVVALAAGLALACCSGDATEAAGEPSEPLPASAADSTVDTEITADIEVTAESEVTGRTESTVPLVVTTEPAAAADAPTPAAEETSSTSPPSSTGETSTTSTSAAPSTTPTTTTLPSDWGSSETVRLRFESQVADVPVENFIAEAMAILTDERGWGQAGFTFVSDPDATYRVVLAEGPEVDQLCLPLRTYSRVSCQNGPVVALNADRWRSAVGHWELDVAVYRGYLVNHEVGHLLGQRHPKPRCPVAGQLAGVMEQQTAGLEGCVGNPWPRDWEIFYAGLRPVVYAPLPDWGPDPVPENREGQ